MNGVSTKDITQEEAASLLDKGSRLVVITVAKMAAAYYGILSEEGTLSLFITNTPHVKAPLIVICTPN